MRVLLRQEANCDTLSDLNARFILISKLDTIEVIARIETAIKVKNIYFLSGIGFSDWECLDIKEGRLKLKYNILQEYDNNKNMYFDIIFNGTYEYKVRYFYKDTIKELF